MIEVNKKQILNKLIEYLTEDEIKFIKSMNAKDYKIEIRIHNDKLDKMEISKVDLDYDEDEKATIDLEIENYKKFNYDGSEIEVSASSEDEDCKDCDECDCKRSKYLVNQKNRKLSEF